MPRARSPRAACSASTQPEALRPTPSVRVRIVRWLLLAVVVAGLAPGILVRTTIGLRSDVAVVTITPVTERAGVSGDLTLTGAWELTSPHGWFGGFSALVAGEGQALIAGTDRGWLLDIDLAGDAPRAGDAETVLVVEGGAGDLHQHVVVGQVGEGQRCEPRHDLPVHLLRHHRLERLGHRDLPVRF